jgi:hypothetical protein
MVVRWFWSSRCSTRTRTWVGRGGSGGGGGALVGDVDAGGHAVDVIRAYYGIVLAREQVVTLESAVRVAQEHVRRAESLVANGLATRSDALLASVQAGELDAQLIEARGRADMALAQLAVLLGSPAEVLAPLPQRLPGSEAIRRLPVDVPVAVERRGDVAAAQLGESAAALDVRRSRSQALPRLNALARYDWNSASRPFEGDENWTVGLLVSVGAIHECGAAGGHADGARPCGVGARGCRGGAGAGAAGSGADGDRLGGGAGADADRGDRGGAEHGSAPHREPEV